MIVLFLWIYFMCDSLQLPRKQTSTLNFKKKKIVVFSLGFDNQLLYFLLSMICSRSKIVVYLCSSNLGIH